MGNAKLVEAVQSKLKLRNTMAREFLAEFLGTFVLIAFGTASVAQSVLTNKANGDFFSINWGWGMGVTLGVLVSGGVSGGHINPAVTVAMAIWGKHPWQKVPVYIVAQYLGAFIASALVYGVYLNALDGFEAERTLATAGIWATYPGAITARNGTVITDYLSSGNGMGDQVVGTMLLLLCVCAITDTRNMEVPKGLVPLLVGLTVLNIGVCFGFNCGYAINPARDLAPRIFTLIAGWGSDTFSAATVEGLAWWWVPVVGPHIGAILGVTLYEVFVALHHPETQDFTLPQVTPHQEPGSTSYQLVPVKASD
ncbi:aquaporin-7-like isoform X1 [Portunus trituberculatus]|uniref:aquaporin-7-like isoform X1 n=1 Tax=Portunus trituberculatus TaxID=210409 RepID=UPI001E1CF8C2|nr:aquaporin-7-like isoform X1 [Portunus trituberculatus]XP_045129914.1 aquaporin-7-like isoform X1 [Portunus trituberculatus]